MNRTMEELDILKDKGVNATLINITTVKSLDSKAVAAVPAGTNCAVAVEGNAKRLHGQIRREMLRQKKLIE